MNKIIKALQFAANAHKDQRRSGGDTPYINHPIAVAAALSDCGITDEDILAAAILHDTVEDTDATIQDIRQGFGSVVAGYVTEVTDDKSKPKHIRKLLQIETAPHKSHGAKLIKLADKFCNIRDMVLVSLPDWSAERLIQYRIWSDQVVVSLGEVHPVLQEHYQVLSTRLKFLQGSL